MLIRASRSSSKLQAHTAKFFYWDIHWLQWGPTWSTIKVKQHDM
jgi:hypothetical protein